MSNNQLELLDILTIISFALQLLNVQENRNQSSNDDIMKELQTQDRDYLQEILENQKRILSMLENSKSV